MFFLSFLSFAGFLLFCLLIWLRPAIDFVILIV